MKPKLLLFLLTILSSFAFGQEQKVLAKFIISDARINKQDVSKAYLDNGAFFVFYSLGDSKNINMGSVMTKSDSQSYGPIFNFDSQTIPESSSDYKKQTISFKWSFQNTYDKEHGTATIKLIKVFKPAGIAFELTMLTEKLDLLVYKGYLEGSLAELE